MSSNLPGNVANIVMVMSTLLYLLTAITPLSSQIFKDRKYLREGFCVYDDPALWFLNSHLLCVFVDTLGALLLYCMAVRWEEFDKGAMGKVKENTIGILGHGFGHFFLYLNYPPPESSTYVEDFAPHQLFLIVASSCVFFYMFFLSISLIPPLHRSALSILHGLALVMLVPISLGFTYVQSVLLLTVAFYEMKAPSKEPHYNDFSCLVHLPVSLVGWVEGMGCEGFVRGIGGHVIYDAAIPLGIMIFAVKRRMIASKSNAKIKVP
ncbi:hypothetical protein TrCOL_g1520 [Triparma columacea]|uniref:Uncharacterized protein n=1 Tax=Triparma columacea TaxID=722753 RepID=A0A9W7LBI6_9STRA|nr:hypothetical protein TrCOL_g1520 [Triparma columacea]